MSRSNDGGPAFPHMDAQILGQRPGMSLRDWFAGQALAGGIRPPSGGDIDTADLAVLVYEMADAMLVEREKPEGQTGSDACEPAE